MNLFSVDEHEDWLIVCVLMHERIGVFKGEENVL